MSSVSLTKQSTNPGMWLTVLRSARSVHALALLGLVILAIYAFVRPTGTSANVLANVLFTLLPLLASVLCFRTARLTTADRLPWMLFGTGCAAWLLGQSVWNWYAIVPKTIPPYPSLADVGFGLFYPIVFAGIVLTIRGAVGALPPRESILDSLILVCATALLVNEMVLVSLDGAAGHWTSSLLVTVTWEFGTLSLVMLVGVGLFVRGNVLIRGPLGILIGAFLSLTATDIIYNHLAMNDAYVYGSFLDFGWYAGFLAFAFAALIAPSFEQMPRSTTDPVDRWYASLVRAALMVASVLVTTGISAYVAASSDASVTMILLVIISGMLLATRLGIAALQTEHLARRTDERDRLTGLVAASRAISSTLDLDQILPSLAAAAAEAVGRERAEVYVFTEDLTVVETSALSGFNEGDTDRLASHLNQPVYAYDSERRVIESLTPTLQLIDEPGIPSEDLETFAEIGKLQTLITPLIAHDRVVGVVDTWTPFDTTPFEPADIAAAAAIGQQAGLAIHNARLLASARQHAAEQEALLRVTQAAVSSLDLDAVLAEIAQASLGVANAEACAIEIWDREQGDTFLAAEATIDDWPGTSAVGKRISFDDWPISPRVLHEQVTFNLLATDEILSPRERAHLLADDTNSMLMVPLVVNETSLGILNLFSRNARRFSNDEVRIATDLAAQISIAIDRARLHEALRERADTDGLTGLLNHRAMLEQLDTETARARRDGPPLSILMIDLDEFKQVNDTHGHLTGDQLLRETAAFLRAGIRDIDVAGRYGGDEFLLLLPNTDGDDARRLACRLLDLADEAGITSEGERIPIQISIGIATTPDDGLTRQELIAVADTRMYEAKSARRWIVAGSH